MRVAVSNIAWDRQEDDSVAELFGRHGVDAIDLVPTKYFSDLAKATDIEIDQVGRWWADHGIEITGMQALLYGTTGLNMFGPEPVRASMLAHLGQVCRIAGRLNAPRLVFGSPRNRDRAGLDDRATTEIAVSFFRSLGDIASECGVLVCLEPNPTRYGANFMTNSDETASMVRQIEHPAIRMQFDTGALSINSEDPFEVLGACAPLIGHVHASEPDLVPLGDGSTSHPKMASALAAFLPQHIVSIEMIATRDEPHIASIKRALGVASEHYVAAPSRSER